MDSAKIGFERKVLRKIFVPICNGEDFHVQTNKELHDLFNEMQLHYHLGHVVRMEDDLLERRVFHAAKNE